MKGGSYGGGGGGSSSAIGGNGAPGLIVITYNNPAPAPAVTTNGILVGTEF